MKTLTIFTPTYNRCGLLPNLFESLRKQTSKDFIWLIIDDGSKDCTEELIKSFIDRKEIEIAYYRQENYGKHIAHNLGVSLCNTELFFCVDSDDTLTRNAVEIVIEQNNKNRRNILGYYFRKGTVNGEIHGMNFPKGIDEVKLIELYEKFKFRGEMAIVLKTKLIKNYVFPFFKGERFITETVFYNQISDLAPMKLIDIVIYIFEYQDDGLTKNSLQLLYKNPQGTAMSYISNVNYQKILLNRIKKMAQFYAWVKLFRIDNSIYKKFRIPLYIKICGKLLSFYYEKMFKNKLKVIFECR